MKKNKSLVSLFTLAFITVVLITNCKKGNTTNGNALSLEKMSNSRSEVSNQKKSNQNELIRALVESDEFKSNPLVIGKIVDLTKASVFYNKGEKTQPVVTIVLLKDGEIAGSVEAVPMNNKNFRLPNGATHFMLYRDFSKFDKETLSGKIDFYDMNYDNHYIGEIKYDKKIPISVKMEGLTAEIKLKYSDIIRSNSLYLKSKTSTIMAVASSEYNGLCDGNGDGNLSFSECFSCFNQSCATLPECFTLCFGIGDTFSWVVLGLPYCQAAITSACIYLSSIY